jgi:tRNA-dihydrouridine synthase
MPLKIRGLVIDPPLALAPMVGLSHTALRTLTKRLGGVGLLYTEMLSAKRIPDENPEISPYLAKSAEETPLFYRYTPMIVIFSLLQLKRLKNLVQEG